MLLSIRQRNKYIIIIHLFLMHTPNSPLSRSLQPTTGTLATRQLHRQTRKRRITIKSNSPLPRLTNLLTIIRSKGKITRHNYNRIPPRIGILRGAGIFLRLVREAPLLNILRERLACILNRLAIAHSFQRCHSTQLHLETNCVGLRASANQAPAGSPPRRALARLEPSQGAPGPIHAASEGSHHPPQTQQTCLHHYQNHGAPWQAKT